MILNFLFSCFLLWTWVIDKCLQFCSVCFVLRFYLGCSEQCWPFQDVEAELAWWFCSCVVTPVGAGSQTSRVWDLNWIIAKDFTGWRRLQLVGDVVPCLGSFLCDVMGSKMRQWEASVPLNQLCWGSIESEKGRKSPSPGTVFWGGLSLGSKEVWQAFVWWDVFLELGFWEKKCYIYALLKLHWSSQRFVAIRNIWYNEITSWPENLPPYHLVFS